MIDWSTHYDPIYEVIGVPANVASSGGQSAAVTVIDRTQEYNSIGTTLIDTVAPMACIRAYELAAAGVALSDLPEGTIDFNGKTWRIKSFRYRNSPAGETDGEVELRLLSEGL